MKTIQDLKKRCKKLKVISYTLLLTDIVIHIIMDLLDFYFSSDVEVYLMLAFFAELSIASLASIIMMLIIAYNVKRLLLIAPICYISLSLCHFFWRLIMEIQSTQGEDSTLNWQRSKRYFEFKIYIYTITLIVVCILLKINITLTILYFRKYLISLHNRIRNESRENFLSSDSSLINNNPPLENSSSWGINCYSVYGEEKNTFNDLNFINKNIDTFLIKPDTVYNRYNHGNKIEHHHATFDESPEIIDGTFHDRFDTPKKIKTRFSSCVQD